MDGGHPAAAPAAPDETGWENAGVAGVTGVALSISKQCLLFRPQSEDSLWSAL